MINALETEDFWVPIKGSRVAVAYFATACCPMCSALHGIVEHLEPSLTAEGIPLVAVDAESHADLCEACDVMSAPALVVFRGGESFRTLDGVTSRRVIVDCIEEAKNAR